MAERWCAACHVVTVAQRQANVDGVLHNQKRFIESGIVYNRGVIPNLPRRTGVEVSIVAHTAGAHPGPRSPKRYDGGLRDPPAQRRFSRRRKKYVEVERVDLMGINPQWHACM